MNWNLINCLVPWFPMPWLFPRCFQKTFFPFISFCTKNTSLKKKKWLTENTKRKGSLPRGRDLKSIPIQRNFPTYPISSSFKTEILQSFI